MLYFNRNGVWFTIPITKDAVYSRELLEKQIHTSLLGLQNLKDRSPDLDQMRFEKKGEYIIKSVFGRDDILIYPPTIMPHGKTMEIKDYWEEILIGIEYTDGTLGAPINGWVGPNGYGIGNSYIGSGIKVGAISGGDIGFMHDIPWNDTADLLSPWKKITYTFPSGTVGERYNFNVQEQGTATKDIYVQSEPGIESVLTELKEQTYSPDYDFDVKWSVVLHGSAVFPEETWGPSTDAWYHWWEVYTSQIEVNGVVVAGPFDYTIDYLYNWVNSHIRYETITYSGETVYGYNYDFSSEAAQPNGIHIDDDRYFYLYSKVTSNNAKSFNIYHPSEPWLLRNTRSYSGTFTHEIKANCSGTEYEVAQKTMDWIGHLRWIITPPSPFTTKCLRIFAESDNQIDPKGLYYAFSYWDPQYMDQETGYGRSDLPPRCQYGMIYAGGVHVTTVGFEAIGTTNTDDPEFIYTEYNYDLNTMRGLPENMNSSILDRIYKKKTNTNKTVTLEE